MDWGTVVSRRAKKEPPAQGGWNIFVTTTGGVGSANPVLHTWIGAACDKGLFGWPCDAKIEELRNDYAFAQTDEDKKRETLEAKRTGKSFPEQSNVYDKYRLKSAEDTK